MEYEPREPTAGAMAGFAQRLHLARRHRNWRQLDLAAQTGIAQATINYLENGKRPPSIETVIKLSIALDVEPGWLAFNEGESGLPEGEPDYVPPVPLNKPISQEARAERQAINQMAHVRSQARGTSFAQEREAIRAVKAEQERERQRAADEAESERESEARYATATASRW